MLIHHIHDALAQVRRLQALILEKRLFRGYSGIARMAGGAIALAGMAIMADRDFPAAPTAHVLGWAAVLAGALAVNYGALLAWVMSKPASQRSLRELAPAFDAVPALAVGAGLSLTLILHGEYDLLFGTWMGLYGLAHMPYRNSLPRANYLVGLFYIAAGIAMLVWPGVSFIHPHPMGLVFGFGEISGGWVLCRLNNATRSEQEEEPSRESDG